MEEERTDPETNANEISKQNKTTKDRGKKRKKVKTQIHTAEEKSIRRLTITEAI